jgi:hypothetical protein
VSVVLVAVGISSKGSGDVTIATEPAEDAAVEVSIVTCPFIVAIISASAAARCPFMPSDVFIGVGNLPFVRVGLVGFAQAAAGV